MKKIDVKVCIHGKTEQKRREESIIQIVGKLAPRLARERSDV